MSARLNHIWCKPVTLRRGRASQGRAARGVVRRHAHRRCLRPPPISSCSTRDGAAPVLLLCDHAGRRVPPELEQLGPERRGAGAAYRLGHRRGRRDPRARPAAGRAGDPQPHVAAGDRPQPAPGHADLDPGDQRRLRRARATRASTPAAQLDRVLRYFLPYHRAVARRIAAFRRAGIVPAVIAIHSFTPRMNGEDRPWQVGRAVARRPAPVDTGPRGAGGARRSGRRRQPALLRPARVRLHRPVPRPADRACRTSCSRCARTRSRPPKARCAMPASSTRRCAGRWPIRASTGCSTATISTAPAA